jgi:mono/diheme cytochrome c family protein
MARPGDYSFQGGAAVYSHVCQSCHMADAMGAIGAGAGYPALAKNVKLKEAGYPVAVNPARPEGDAAFGRASERPADRRCGQLCTHELRQQV